MGRCLKRKKSRKQGEARRIGRKKTKDKEPGREAKKKKGERTERGGRLKKNRGKKKPRGITSRAVGRGYRKTERALGYGVELKGFRRTKTLGKEGEL